MSQNTQKSNYFRRLLTLLFLLSIIFGLIFAWRARPVMRENESYHAIFSSSRFLQKIQSKVPDWMEKQLDLDFCDIRPITDLSLEKAYETLEKRLEPKAHFYHYRILDNMLYKFIPSAAENNSKDTRFEKAFKTLLSQATLPDVDFILCPMDGLPEPYIASDCYIMDDPQDQVPILAQAKLKEPLTHSVVLIPDQFSLSNDWYEAIHEIAALNSFIPWEEKIPKAIWRGGLTDKGTPTDELPALEMTSRIQISLLSQLHPAQIDAGLNWIEPPLIRKKWETIFKVEASKSDHLRCKYLPVLDGHMCTYPGYQWRLFSNSVSLKQDSDQIQWFYSALQPYEYYIPIANDMSDLLEKMHWAILHDEDARRISHTAQKFASENLMYEDCYYYLYLVLKRYATHQKIDFIALKKKTKADPRWVCIQYRKRLALFKMMRRVRERIERFSS